MLLVNIIQDSHHHLAAATLLQIARKQNPEIDLIGTFCNLCVQTGDVDWVAEEVGLKTAIEKNPTQIAKTLSSLPLT